MSALPKALEVSETNVGALIRPVSQVVLLAESVKEISIDFIEVENRTLRSRWFHGEEELDLFVWMDDKNRLFKAQANVMGQVLEWNIMNGVRTGVSIEEERHLGDDNEMTLREDILFDRKLRQGTQKFIVEFVEHLKCVDENLKQDLCEAFRGEAALSLMRHFKIEKDLFEVALDYARSGFSRLVFFFFKKNRP